MFPFIIFDGTKSKFFKNYTVFNNDNININIVSKTFNKTAQAKEFNLKIEEDNSLKLKKNYLNHKDPISLFKNGKLLKRKKDYFLKNSKVILKTIPKKKK